MKPEGRVALGEADFYCGYAYCGHAYCGSTRVGDHREVPRGVCRHGAGWRGVVKLGAGYARRAWELQGARPHPKP